jgi:hypothetical protein
MFASSRRSSVGLAFGSLAVTWVLSGCDSQAPSFIGLMDQDVAVGEEVRLLVLATDPNGGRIRYDYRSDIADARTRVTFSHLPMGAAEFRWTPRAADIGIWYIDFRADNGASTAEESVRVHVRSAVGKDTVPRFVRPQGAGTAFDLKEESEISLTVEVLDLDSAQVKITQKPEIDGSVFEETAGRDGKEGVWRWRPTEEQRRRADPQLATFWADDGEHAPTRFSYLLVLSEGVSP